MKTRAVVVAKVIAILGLFAVNGFVLAKPLSAQDHSGKKYCRFDLVSWLCDSDCPPAGCNCSQGLDCY